VFGGFNGVDTINKLYIYDPAADSWARGRDLPGPRFGSAVAAIGGKIIIAGGTDGTSAVATTFEYDPATDNYAPKANMPMALLRIHGAALEDRGEVHVFAGSFDGQAHLVYNVMADTWSTAAAMPVGVTDPGTVTIGGRIYVLGGLG